RLSVSSLLTMVAIFSWAGSIPAATIGLKFGINGNGNQQQTNTASGGLPLLAPTDTAGAPSYAQSNWNTFGRFGDNATNTFGTNLYAILDSASNDTHITIGWDATGNWSEAGGGN